ncbi:transketolase [uncultured Limosilactobacillus sp.]|uniref:transketolase n=1 Tax=uncultured Limosilactobacillus sp. TaxID=2837629 RepID=UPI0025DE9A68|nr:transketolase [uncultured Limosilactobacillus sp.]
MEYTDKDQQAVNAIRALSMDEITNANSGHTGITLSAAPLLYTIYRNMNIDVHDPQWFNRDRFVLSGGHGSAMLYAILHLIGYDISLDDLKHFRTLGSKTPGHPEITTPGVDAATGPLGQGFGMAVGMAMAAKHLAAIYNRPGFDIVNNHIFVEVGDGDLMEGISHETASLAGHLHLNNLIVLYDSNRNTMDSALSAECNDNVAERFKSYGWNYLTVEDGNDLNAMDSAIQIAKDEQSRPTIIEVHTVLGYASPFADSHKAHGVVLTEEQVRETKQQLGYEHDPFDVPDDVYTTFKEIKDGGQKARTQWNDLLQEYQDKYPELYQRLVNNLTNKEKINVDDFREEFADQEATRDAIHQILQATISKTDVNLWGGSADLGSSDKTYFDGDEGFQPRQYEKRNVAFGIREFAEGAELNGITLYGGSRVFGNTFLIFSEYMRSAIRQASLMQIPTIYLFGHDSISLGPDGPTHQPIEQLEGYRAMPNLIVLRPADALETLYAWEYTLNEHHAPIMMVLGRQKLPTLKEYRDIIKSSVAKGGYILSEASNGNPSGILMGSGSEVSLLLAAQKELASKGIAVRVVSMPSFELFLKQPTNYREAVLPSKLRNRMAVEMATTYDWAQFTGLGGTILGINHFGESGNGDDLITKSGFTVENIVQQYVDHFTK